MDKVIPPRMIEIGAGCNQACLFCCQVEQRGLKDKTTEQIQKEIDQAAADGVNNLSIQGGEFTMRQDSIKLVRYAYDKGVFKNIHVTTNGIMFSYPEFAKKMARAGLSAANFSIHSPKSQEHDRLTQVKGSFEKAMKGIKNLIACRNPTTRSNVNVCSSITLVKSNHTDLIDLIDLLAPLGVHDFHINYSIPTGDALKNFEEMVPRYSDIEMDVHRTIKHCKDKRYKLFLTGIPVCFMQGYEEFLDETHKSEFTMVPFYHPGKQIVKDYKNEIRMSMKVKQPSCKECRYFFICEGVFKEYVKRRGFDEIRPVEGEQIKELFGWHIK